jgi:hypothetical protein
MVASPPPWDSWSLDEQFFGSLCRWTLQNPGSSESLTEVLNKISASIDTTKDLRGLIPDPPFPARSLIEALLSLLKLGIVRSDWSYFVAILLSYQAIANAKQTVYDFSKDVVR